MRICGVVVGKGIFYEVNVVFCKFSILCLMFIFATSF